jgi:hypothetical protein
MGPFGGLTRIFPFWESGGGVGPQITSAAKAAHRPEHLSERWKRCATRKARIPSGSSMILRDPWLLK